MDRLDVADGFDVHEYRDDLKLLRQDADSYHLRNRGDLACPACDRRFEKLFVSTARTVTFDPGPEEPFCLVRTGGEELLVATH